MEDICNADVKNKASNRSDWDVKLSFHKSLQREVLMEKKLKMLEMEKKKKLKELEHRMNRHQKTTEIRLYKYSLQCQVIISQ